jgi:endonuclease/exonuclease/phosphatase family metal-dependent hydrolase
MAAAPMVVGLILNLAFQTVVTRRPTPILCPRWGTEPGRNADEAARVVADLIASMDLDLIAVQEVADINTFNTLIQRLTAYDGRLSTHSYGDGTYQRVGFIWKRDLVQVTDALMIFSGSGWEFPRPPFQAKITVTNSAGSTVDFLAITLHLKAGIGSEDRDRRRDAIALLEGYVRDQVDGPGDDEILLLGDFNERLDYSSGEEVFSPFRDSPGSYSMLTESLADSGAYTYLFASSFIDHLISTSALGDEIGAASAHVIPLDAQVVNYAQQVTDHLPVVIRMPIF